MRGLIAEIGNHHYGDMGKAKELIAAAHESGAHFIKLQMVDAEAASAYGTMPREFYRACEISIDNYEMLLDYAESIRAKLFFSYFGGKYDALREIADLQKISGKQTLEWPEERLERYNRAGTVISIPQDIPKERLKRIAPYIDAMHPMMVGPYPPGEARLDAMHIIQPYVHENLGYSDHSPGISTCMRAINAECWLIEKHFYLGDTIVCEGRTYRDCAHSATPAEFKKLADYYREAQIYINQNYGGEIA